ncbi:Peptidase family M13 [Nesidiocoris tenuis]|uniref:Peptidase family M13 n=1 Tax=Nesidiocoris tenuis TaxID=355587 RepID=A0ABN7B731_9HEMI|nr:Peptidase family M13 [Nesidiocoris tenuis]
MDQGKEVEESADTGSTHFLVGVTSKRKRQWKEFVKNRTKSEKRLALAVTLISAFALACFISLIVIVSNRPKDLCYTTQCIKTASMLLDSLDTRHDPCDDFYKFTCGKWAEAHLAQSNTNSWFSDRTRYLSSKMESVLSENATSSDPLPVVYAKSLFASCMDTNKLDELGLEPMFSVLERVGLPKTLPDENSGVTFSISKTLARIQRVLSMDLLVQLSMALDPKTNKTVMVVSPTPGGPSLPELISSDDADDGGRRPAAAVSSREALGLRLAYMTGVMAAIQPQANVSELGTAALKILVIDSQIRSDIQKAESDEAPTLMTYNELQDIMDNANTTGSPKQKFDWNEYVTVLLDGLGVEFSGNDTLYVNMPDYFALLGARLHRSRPESFQRYLWWFLVTSMVPHTTDELRSLKDDLYEALFRRPRQTRSSKCVKYVKSFFNMAIAFKFASMDNLERTTTRVRSMLEDITDAFSRLVNSLPWMDDTTKGKAAKKARAIKSFIGYPDWLLVPGQLEEVYKGMEVVDGQFLGSMVGLKSAEVKKILKGLGQPPANETRGWVADPLDVNAFYGRGTNAVAIPAGILQAPFYFLGLEALNYGAIGSILGHELTHAFDVEGKDYDETGRRVSWWDSEMTKAYDERAQCFVKQYDKFGFTANYSLNGTLTLAENIADNGGLREAFHAYEHFVDRNGQEPKLPGLEGYDHKQLFFIAFTNVWCEKSNLQDDISSLNDVHSPNKFRVLGTLRNLEEFSRVWNCPAGSNMNPKGKCVLW